MTKKALDLNLGFNSEDYLFNTLKIFFNEPNLKKTVKFSLTDFSRKIKNKCGIIRIKKICAVILYLVF